MLSVSTISDRKVKNQTFKGIPERLRYGIIVDYSDALRAWEKLKSAKYLDVHSDKTSPYNKFIRKYNYSFLDKLTTVYDKSQFVRNFCSITRFPALAQISDNIDKTFKNCLTRITSDLNSQCYTANPYTVIDSGYDTTCSLGLRRAFPGSDLDKGYIIIEGNHPYYSDEKLVNDIKGGLWFNLDQRIVSLNHPDTYPDVYTKKQVLDMLNKLDLATRQVIAKKLGIYDNDLLRTILTIIKRTLFNRNLLYQDAAQNSETDPYKAAVLNRDLAKTLPVSDREEAKNFAFFIETVLSNLRKNPIGKNDKMFIAILDSIFARKSNVTQNSAWQQKINSGYMKSKLKHREQLERDFNSMDIHDKYELIKEIIKSSSNDQGPRFAKFFTNDDDISGRYQHLLESLR